MDQNTIKTIQIQGLPSVPPSFRLLDINRPISPHPQALHYVPVFFLFPEEIVIEYENVNRTSPLSTRFENLLQEKHSWQIKQAFSPKNTANSGKIPLGLHVLPEGLIKDQSFSLSIKDNTIKLQAFTDQGMFYAIGALSQLIHQNQRKWVVQQVEIHDYPTIPLRGIIIPYKKIKRISSDEIVDLLSGLLLMRMNIIEIDTFGEPQKNETTNTRIIQEFAEQNFIECILATSLKESVLTIPLLIEPYLFLNLPQITKSLAILSKNSIKKQKTKLLLDVSSSSDSLPDWRILLHGIAVGLDWAWNPIDRPKDQYYRAFYTELFGMHNPHLFADMIEKVSELVTLLSPEANSTLSKQKWQKWSRKISIAREMIKIANRTIIRHQEFMRAIEILLNQIEHNLKMH